MAKDKKELSKELHLTFVAMLFALAIGEVAIEAGRILDPIIHGSIGIATSLPACFHLLLAAIVIAASWVGWRNSETGGTEIKSVFGRDFAELLVDVLLVVCYFLLARLAELPTGSPLAIVPDASPEAQMIVVIMAIYVVWDVLSCLTHPSKLKQRFWASLLCFAISLAALLWVLPLSSHDGTAVIFMDLALLGLVFLFRAMKLRDLTRQTLGSGLHILVCAIFFVLFSILARQAAQPGTSSTNLAPPSSSIGAMENRICLVVD